MNALWRDARKTRKSRARFAQNAMKPAEVAPEWNKARDILGSPEDALLFVERALSRFGVPLEQSVTCIMRTFMPWKPISVRNLPTRA